MKQNKSKKIYQCFARFTKTFAQSIFNALIGLIGSLPLSANAATVYFNDFQGVLGTDWGSEWSTTAASGIHTASAPNPDYADTRLFLGEYGNDTLTLSLGGLAPHTTATVSFSLYLIRSWDGNDTTVVSNDPLGSDTWSLGIAGGPTLLNTTFSNGNSVAGQNYDGAYSTYTYTQWTPCDAYAGYSGPGNAPMTGANECYSLGYKFTDANVTNENMDSVYNFSFLFAHNSSDLVLNFSASGLQGLADESWGLDNVQVQISAVPVPAAAWLFGSGLLGLFQFSRRTGRSNTRNV